MRVWQRQYLIKAREHCLLFLKKSQIQSYDEKEQQNRFFTEWLESIFITGIAKADNIKNIIRND